MSSWSGRVYVPINENKIRTAMKGLGQFFYLVVPRTCGMKATQIRRIYTHDTGSEIDE